ncbi:GNAT family N-acetyltransferase [Chitinophaga sp. GCM10012297]|uniref:GNAT family N-acetyltransferase n=1 Tax=Chitinophaga chungangae TaxID=2821488 RepID=A0ABS3YKD7_9BACT|nr:GNAT family protein [Chitinophaga chungangae]MBO9155122.1 GNAT family N-acetyltransferase [Chitinophaga chungangae]
MEQPVLGNKRVLLRPMQPSDLEVLLEVALEPSLWEVGLGRIGSREDLERYMQAAFREREQGLCLPYVVIDKETGEVAGSTRFCSIVEMHKRTEIGYTWIHPRFQRTGLNRAMKFAMLQYAFETWGMNRVELKTDERNEKSRNAMLGIGCKQEGVFRHHMITWNGHLLNSVYFSILREEWPEIKERIFGKYDF